MIPRIYFVGTAGAGKSSLVAGFQRWLENIKLDAATFNLDPGAEYIPYSPDFDIREKISLVEVMQEYDLGPNGAQIAASDLLIQHLDEFAEEIDAYESDYILIDVPGQLELFAFRQSSREIIRTLGERNSAIVYLIDSTLAKVPSSFVSSKFLAMSVLTRFYIPFLPLISKSDLLSPEERSYIEIWEKNPEELLEALKKEKGGMSALLAEKMMEGINSFDILGKSKFVSSQSDEGMEDIYEFLSMIFSGGEDLEER